MSLTTTKKQTKKTLSLLSLQQQTNKPKKRKKSKVLSTSLAPRRKGIISRINGRDSWSASWQATPNWRDFGLCCAASTAREWYRHVCMATEKEEICVTYIWVLKGPPESINQSTKSARDWFLFQQLQYINLLTSELTHSSVSSKIHFVVFFSSAKFCFCSTLHPLLASRLISSSFRAVLSVCFSACLLACLFCRCAAARLICGYVFSEALDPAWEFFSDQAAALSAMASSGILGSTPPPQQQQQQKPYFATTYTDNFDLPHGL